MANTPTYSLRGTRINFNELRAQARRLEVDEPKKPSKTAPEDTVKDQKLKGGFIPMEPPVEEPAPAPKATPAAAPAPAARPILTAAPKKPEASTEEIDE